MDNFVQVLSYIVLGQTRYLNQIALINFKLYEKYQMLYSFKKNDRFEFEEEDMLGGCTPSEYDKWPGGHFKKVLIIILKQLL